jgi:hypothetical protein
MRVTPSEIVVLRGECFAKEAAVNSGSEALLGGGKASSEELAHAAIAAALLANQQRGVLRFTVDLGEDAGGLPGQAA